MYRLELEHWSYRPLQRVYSAQQMPLHETVNWPDEDLRHQLTHRLEKPEGLWVSPKGEDDWISGCEVNGYRCYKNGWVTAVHVLDWGRILHVDGVGEMLRLRRDYGTEIPGPSRLERVRIAWESVAENYSGILIAPYVWQLRLPRDPILAMDFHWYYSWDTASGVIWDASIIELGQSRPNPNIPRCGHCGQIRAGLNDRRCCAPCWDSF